MLEKFKDEWYIHFEGWRFPNDCGCDLDGVPRGEGMEGCTNRMRMGTEVDGQYIFKLEAFISGSRGADECSTATLGTPGLAPNAVGYVKPRKCDESSGVSLGFELTVGIDWNINVNVLGNGVETEVRHRITQTIGKVASFEEKCSNGNASNCSSVPEKPILN
ncbi:MAG: hypothetical protein JNK57_01015 [Planctomycetaceae bacterium]|nr:hypothetical protein [Planctomycetaceae bacterium]